MSFIWTKHNISRVNMVENSTYNAALLNAFHDVVDGCLEVHDEVRCRSFDERVDEISNIKRIRDKNGEDHKIKRSE